MFDFQILWTAEVVKESSQNIYSPCLASQLTSSLLLIVHTTWATAVNSSYWRISITEEKWAHFETTSRTSTHIKNPRSCVANTNERTNKQPLCIIILYSRFVLNHFHVIVLVIMSISMFCTTILPLNISVY